MTVEEAQKLRTPHQAKDGEAIKNLITEADEALKSIGVKRKLRKNIEATFKKAIDLLKVQYDTSEITVMRGILARTLALGSELL